MNHLTIQHLPELPFDMEESVNQLRVNLGFCGDQIKTVVITSSIPNEGKSFIAIYLWKMLAELGSRVLLIDCDLRKSEMRTKYGIGSTEKITGIAHYLPARWNCRMRSMRPTSQRFYDSTERTGCKPSHPAGKPTLFRDDRDVCRKV